MATPDPKYLPQAKTKKKAKKVYTPKAGPVFPPAPKAKEVSKPKHKSPRGDKHVWPN
jgi:hypothetical protein